MFSLDCQIEFSELYIYIYWNIIERSFIIYYILPFKISNFMSTLNFFVSVTNGSN